MRVTTDDGVGLHVVDEGDGPVTMLVGGYGMAVAAWALQRAALVEAGQRVVSVDRRSHGASDYPASGQDLDRHGRDLANVMDALNLDEVCLVGASMGASTAWAYVAGEGTSRLRGIVSIDQTPKMVNDDEWSFGLYDLTDAGVDDFVNGFPGAHNPFHVLPPMETLALMLGDGTPYPFDETRALLRDHTLRDWRPVLPAVDVPVLVVGGRFSPLWPVESSRYIADTVKRGRLIEFECGHVPFLELATPFNAALLSFVAETGVSA